MSNNQYLLNEFEDCLLKISFLNFKPIISNKLLHFLKDKLHAKNVNYNLSQSWLESFCYKNPDAIFKKAVDFFLKEFTK